MDQYEDINAVTSTNITNYNLEVFQKVQNYLEIELATQHDDTDQKVKKTEVPADSKEEEPKKDDSWRHMPSNCDMDLMIISSYGDKLTPSVDVILKLQDNEMAYTASGSTILARKELEALTDIYRKDKTLYLREVCPDWPGAQVSKNEQMDRIKQFFKNCDTEGVVLHYTGHGEKGTGNWCFKDGVITFEDIFGLYMDCMRGKRLTIVSDCSYSGNWIRDCVKKLDEIGIPSCGHHTREQGILLKVFASCKEKEESKVMVFAKEGIGIGKSNGIVYFQKKLSSGQTTGYGDFRLIRCSKPDLPCEIVSTWNDRILVASLIYLVRGKDRGKEAWHYVLVDEDKLEDFKAKVASGNIDVAKYGKVLHSGWGKDPPKDIARRIGLKYWLTVDPAE